MSAKSTRATQEPGWVRIGLLAILLWATLAVLTAATGQVPPFLLTALTFAIGGTVGLAAALA